MANDRLRTAILAANLDVDRLAAAVGVDPKTADRWISKERVPHRKTRHRILEVLGGREEDLWPALAADLRPAPTESELVHLYESRSAITRTGWEALLNGVEDSMDMLVFSGAFLVEQYNFVPFVRTKAEAGVRFRLLVGNESAAAVMQRAVEEGTPGGLEGRIQLMRRYLSEVVELNGVEIRTHGEILATASSTPPPDSFSMQGKQFCGYHPAATCSAKSSPSSGNSPYYPDHPRPHGPLPRNPGPREPGATTGPAPYPPPANTHHKINTSMRRSARHATRGFGSDKQSRPPAPAGEADPAPRPTRRVFTPAYKLAIVSLRVNRGVWLCGWLRCVIGGVGWWGCGSRRRCVLRV